MSDQHLHVNHFIPNTSAIPNILFDYWMYQLNSSEFKVLMCIARKTYGWHKNSDSISVKQIEKMTGLSRNGILNSIKGLTAHDLLIKIKSKTSDGDDAPNQYTINIHCLGGGSAMNALGVVQPLHPGGSATIAPTKERLYTKENIQNSITPKKESADAVSAFADEGDFDNSQKEKPKRIKPPTSFSPKVKEVADKMLNILVACNPVYRPPKNLQKFHENVQIMIEQEEQNPDLLLKTFEWACSDCVQRDNFKGWQSVVCANKRKGKESNPAEIFRGHFSTIYAQMISSPKRKFAPSSDDQKGLEKMMEFDKRAL